MSEIWLLLSDKLAMSFIPEKELLSNICIELFFKLTLVVLVGISSVGTFVNSVFVRQEMESLVTAEVWVEQLYAWKRVTYFRTIHK